MDGGLVNGSLSLPCVEINLSIVFFYGIASSPLHSNDWLSLLLTTKAQEIMVQFFFSLCLMTFWCLIIRGKSWLSSPGRNFFTFTTHDDLCMYFPPPPETFSKLCMLNKTTVTLRWT
jgi:hypothetical protein